LANKHVLFFGFLHFFDLIQDVPLVGDLWNSLFFSEIAMEVDPRKCGEFLEVLLGRLKVRKEWKR